MSALNNILAREQKFTHIREYGIQEYHDGECTKEDYLFAFRSGVLENLSEVPESMIDSEMCITACVHNESNIKYVPREFMTQELCDYVFENNSYSIKYIPEEFIAEDYFQSWFHDDDDGTFRIFDIDYIHYFPKKFLTAEFCRKLLDDNIDTIVEIPQEYTDEADWDKAILNGLLCLKYLPEHLKTRERCYAAYKNHASELKYFPEEFLEGTIERVNDYYLITLCDISQANRSQITCKFDLELGGCECDDGDDSDFDCRCWLNSLYVDDEDYSVAITNHITIYNDECANSTECRITIE